MITMNEDYIKPCQNVEASDEMSNGPLTRFALSELLVIRGFGLKPS